MVIFHQPLLLRNDLGMLWENSSYTTKPPTGKSLTSDVAPLSSTTFQGFPSWPNITWGSNAAISKHKKIRREIGTHELQFLEKFHPGILSKL